MARFWDEWNELYMELKQGILVDIELKITGISSSLSSINDGSWAVCTSLSVLSAVQCGVGSVKLRTRS